MPLPRPACLLASVIHGTLPASGRALVPVEWRLAMETWELEAREVLDDLLATYYKLGDSGRIPEQAGLFEPDGVVELYGRGEFVGREAIINAYRGLNDNHVAEPDVTYIRHFSSNYTVEFQSRTDPSLPPEASLSDPGQ